MSSVRRFVVEDLNGQLHLFTAEELYERILEDSQSDYDWITSTSKLVEVCRNPKFSNVYAIKIKSIILNCYANIAHNENSGGDGYRIDTLDLEAVRYCYNSLYGIDSEDAKKARKKYLKEIISAACRLRFFDPHYHPGDAFQNLFNSFVDSNVEKYISEKRVDFNELSKTMNTEFIELIKSEEEKGSFSEDRKIYESIMTQFWKRLK